MGPAPIETDQQSSQAQPGLHPGFGSNARVWLLRHAEVHEDYHGRAYGNLDVPLSASGQADTERLAEEFGRLDFTSIISSPLVRAKQLASGIADRSGTELIVDAGLAEIFRGSWQGRAVDELPRDQVDGFYADPWTFDEHGGETDAEVLARAWPVLAQAIEQNPGGQVLLVAHYNVIRVLVAYALGIPSTSSFAFRVDPGRACLLLDVRAERAESRTEVPQTNGWVLRHSNVRSPHEIVGLRADER
ncbi:MAG: alpha-ribazole phosphatase [Planctomycetota bacterium]|jgi:alpha-ribazole phosphatase